MTYIRGNRVILRNKTLADAHEDYVWRSDPELSRLDDAEPLKMPLSQFLSYYEEDLNYPSTARNRFAIEDLHGKHIGNCMYYDIDLWRGETELGIMIGDREYWDKGYGTEAVSLLMTHIFSDARMRRIYLHTLDWNIRAQRSFQKCGFVPVKKIQRHGNTLVLMEISRESWRERNRDGLKPSSGLDASEGELWKKTS